MNISKVLLPGFKNFEDNFSGFAAVPEPVTIAVDGVEVVFTTARGTATGPSTRVRSPIFQQKHSLRFQVRMERTRQIYHDGRIPPET